MRRIVPLAALALLLAGCASAEPANDKAACQEYSTVISDWALNPASGETARVGVAMKLRTDAATLASDELAKQIKIMADIVEFSTDLSTLTAEQEAAGGAIKKACAAEGVEY